MIDGIKYGIDFGYNYGWVCPKCGNVYGPNVLECHRCNNKEPVYTSTTTIYNGGNDNGERR